MQPADARTVSVAATRLRGWLAGYADRHGEITVAGDARTVVLTGADGDRAWVTVPFAPRSRADPVADAAGSAPDLLAILLAQVERTRRVGVLLVRRGGHAAGVFDGVTLVSSKVDSSYVQGTTKAGGWSQQRYARRRANQSKAAFADAADIAARILLPHARSLDAVVCGGDRKAVDTVLADPRLAQLTALVTNPFLAVPDPRLRVLQATPEQFLAVQIALSP